MDSVDQLEALCAAPRTHTTSCGEAIEISPIRVRQLAQVARAAAPVMDSLAALAEQPADRQVQAFGGLLVERTDDMVGLVAALLDRPVDWVGDLRLDDVVSLAALAIEVNADFFVGRLRPAIDQLSTVLTTKLAPGSTSLPT